MRSQGRSQEWSLDIQIPPFFKNTGYVPVRPQKIEMNVSPELPLMYKIVTYKLHLIF